MVNHPNRAKRRAVTIQHYSNSGLGWELIPAEMSGVEGREMTRAEADAMAGDRDIESTAVTIHDDYGETIGLAERGQRRIAWS